MDDGTVQGFSYKEKFFNSNLSKEMGVIERLSGSALFRQQIIDGKAEKNP